MEEQADQLQVPSVQTQTPHQAILYAVTFIIMFFAGLGVAYLGLLRSAFVQTSIASHQPVHPKTQTNGGTYTNTQYHYQFTYPIGITIKEAVKPSQQTSTTDAILAPGTLQQSLFEKNGLNNVCVTSVLPNNKGLTIAEWAKMYRVNSVGGNNLVTVTGDANLGGYAAKTFSLFLFDHSDFAIAAVYKNNIYLIRYPETENNPNFDTDPQRKDLAKACSHMIRTFHFL